MLATLELILRIDIEKEIIKADTENFRIRHNVKKYYKLLHKYDFFNLSLSYFSFLKFQETHLNNILPTYFTKKNAGATT